MIDASQPGERLVTLWFPICVRHAAPEASPQPILEPDVPELVHRPDLSKNVALMKHTQEGH
jgi:hypothetical protein